MLADLISRFYDLLRGVIVGSGDYIEFSTIIYHYKKYNATFRISKQHNWAERGL